MLTLPFFEDRHREVAASLATFAHDVIEPMAVEADEGDPSEAGRRFIQHCAAHGLLGLLVPARDGGSSAAPDRLDLRTICLVREALAGASGCADSVFAVDGLGSHPVVLGGDARLRAAYLPRVARGESIAAFALTEPEAGSDVASLQTQARRDGSDYVLDGTKTLISNAGIADFYVVFARAVELSEAEGRPRLSAFVVETGTPGLRVELRTRLSAPHPIGDLELSGCRVAAGQRLGREGDGFKLALGTLDFFRATVGASACGMAARALTEARAYAGRRRLFSRALAEFQATRMAIADMQTELDAARLLVYRAAWVKDQGAARVPQESSEAKLFATEAAQRIVDRAVQLHGGIGVTRGTCVERLYREVRAPRIYEGTSEIQRLIIADHLLAPDV
jgi:acyl-CoA dehydrogenase